MALELYVLDSLLRRIKAVDKWKSLIWTERFNEYGDFQLVIESSLATRTLFTPNTWLALNRSKRCMIIDTVTDTIDDEGVHLLEVQGKSLEALFLERVIKGTMNDLTTEPTWIASGTAAAVAREMFNDICYAGVLSTHDRLPFYQFGIKPYPTENITDVDTVITTEIEPQQLYTALTNHCQMYDLGFRLVRLADEAKLYFDVYNGNDRTSGQTALAAIMFSPELENVKNTTELNSVAGSKNIAYVFSKVGVAIVPAQDVDPDMEGFDRRVLCVKADDIDDTTPSVATAKMIQRGLEELAKNRTFSGFDGEVTELSQYVYDVDYFLGDLVEMRNRDDKVNTMRVTEQIFVSDSEGERSYPTLSLRKYIMPGTWLAWQNNQKWIDLDTNTTLVWATAD